MPKVFADEEIRRRESASFAAPVGRCKAMVGSVVAAEQAVRERAISQDPNAERLRRGERGPFPPAIEEAIGHLVRGKRRERTTLGELSRVEVGHSEKARLSAGLDL